jgi:CRISPR-associated protein Cas6
MYIDLCFPVGGGPLPTDHAYLLFAALSRLHRHFHEPGGPRFAPINGDRGERGHIRLFGRSRLRVRLPADQIADLLPLAGRSLDVGGHTVRLGAPTVTPLELAPTLAARLVTFKHADGPDRFLAVAREKLAELGIAGEPGIPLVQKGQRANEPRRRVVRVKGRRIVGYPLQVAGLTAEESVLLQERGLGGRIRMGCGLFLPWGPTP